MHIWLSKEKCARTCGQIGARPRSVSRIRPPATTPTFGNAAYLVTPAHETKIQQRISNYSIRIRVKNSWQPSEHNYPEFMRQLQLIQFSISICNSTRSDLFNPRNTSSIVERLWLPGRAMSTPVSIAMGPTPSTESTGTSNSSANLRNEPPSKKRKCEKSYTKCDQCRKDKQKVSSLHCYHMEEITTVPFWSLNLELASIQWWNTYDEVSLYSN